MEFRLLGPLEVEGEDGVVPLGSGKQRALLAILLLRANEAVSRDSLIDDLWGEEPPASAAHSLEVYVSRLRKALLEAGANGALTTRGSGYELRVTSEQSDAGRFRQLVEEAHGAEPARASELLFDALALWRGPALSDVSLQGAARSSAEGLDELRLVALEERIEADLALGRHRQLVGELQPLVADHPLRERLRSQHMRALYGAGRQADALASYRDAQRELAELGLEPSPELRDLQRQILNHDPALRVPRGEEPQPGRRASRRGWLAAAFALLLAAGASALAIVLTRGSSAEPEPVVAVDNSVGLVDPATNRLVADIPIGGAPSNRDYRSTPNLAYGLGSIWASNADDGTLLRIDPRSRRVVRTIGVGSTPGSITAGHGAVWVESASGTEVLKLDSLGNITQRIALPHSPVPSYLRGPASIASGSRAIWVVYGLAQLAKIDPRSGHVEPTTPNFGGVVPGQVLEARGTVWATGTDQGLLVRVDPRTGAVAGTTAPAGGALAFWFELARGPGGLWVTDPEDNLVWRVDPTAMRANGSVAVGRNPVGIAFAYGSIWVTDFLAGVIERIDPASMRVVARVHTPAHPGDIAAGPGGIWVTFGGTGPSTT